VKASARGRKKMYLNRANQDKLKTRDQRHREIGENFKDRLRSN
jgi:hypothetical protein